VSALLPAFAAGLIFAVGLVLSGMTNPAKVIGFLDVGGRWDPSLAFVMMGAIGVFLPVFHLSKRRQRPLLADAFAIPDKSIIDGRLLAGAALFGLGWGAGGYCPGPAVASAATGATPVLIFLGCMLAGMAITRAVAK
jgi:uncharacterized membrane protein YedE/YeeE